MSKSYAASQATKEARLRCCLADSPGFAVGPEIAIPLPEQLSTSDFERANLLIRMNMRRSVQPIYRLSKKIEDYVHARSSPLMVYNFCQVRGATNKTPAVAAGVSAFQWTIEEVVSMADPLSTQRLGLSHHLRMCILVRGRACKGGSSLTVQADLHTVPNRPVVPSIGLE